MWSLVFLFWLWIMILTSSPASAFLILGVGLLIAFPDIMGIIYGAVVAGAIGVWVLVEVWREIKAIYG